ncbi:hypothetical protein DSO57_1038361, partial [Entomophthora muscae]
HFTAYGSEFSTNSQKVLTLLRSSLVTTEIGLAPHLICNPGIFQNYDLFVSSLLSSSGEDEESSTSSVPQFAGLTRFSSTCKYNQKFCSLQSRLQASDTEACNRSQQIAPGIFIHHNLPKELEPLIREVVKWNWKYLSSKTHSPLTYLLPRLFIPDQGLTLSNPSTWHRAKVWGRFLPLLLRKSLEEGTITSALTVDQRIIFYQPVLSSKHPPFANKTSSLALLSLNNTSKSPTV